MSNFKNYGLSWEAKTEDIFEYCDKNIPYIVENKKNEIKKLLLKRQFVVRMVSQVKAVFML